MSLVYNLINNSLHVCLLMTHIIIYYIDITTVLQKVPDEFDLLSLLAGIDHKWYEIGVSLQIRLSFLDRLSHSHKRDMVKLSEVLTEWRVTMSSPVTWENIISSLEGPILQQRSIAHEIRNYLTRPEVYSKYQGM